MLVLVIDKILLQTESNHPVHILNNKDKFSASSFIPFCSFGEEFIGEIIDDFDIPVCNIFKPKHYLDQLCYETNLQKQKDSLKIDKQLEKGFTLVLDYNEERQISNKITSKNESNISKSIYSKENDRDSFLVYVNTISICLYVILMFFNLRIFV